MRFLTFLFPSNSVFAYRKNPVIIWKYIFMDFFFSFTITLVFFVVIFVVNQLLLLTKNVLQIDIPFVEVLKLLVYALPNNLSLSIPFATLVACLMSVGHFSTFNEFVAMKANGISFANIFMPYLILSFVIMSFSLIANEILLPLGTINYSKQFRKILSLNPQLGLEQNSIKRYQDDIIIIKGVDGQSIEGIVIIDRDSAGDKRVILADSAQLVNNAEKKGVISIELNNINSLSTGEKVREYNYFLGDIMFYNILLKDLTTSVQTLTPDQQSMKDLYIHIKNEFKELIQPQEIQRSNIVSDMTQRINSDYNNISSQIEYQYSYNGLPSSINMFPYYVRLNEQRSNVFFSRNYRISEIVFFRKLAYPVAIILFVIIAFPMGLFYTRSGRTVGFGVGLIISFVYWFLLVLNQSIAIKVLSTSPFFIMWYPNIAMLILGIILMIVKRS